MSNTSGTHQFSGEYYAINLVTDGNRLTVEVEHKETTEQWRATFEKTFIEDLTRKTGNFKQFSVFANMLESAITSTSESVCLDLLTYADLELLRNKKSGASVEPPASSRYNALNSKRYLILTYTVEFDRIHYPLPLPYVGKPDPKKLQETIRHLQDELNTIKQQGGQNGRSKEFEKLKKEFERVVNEKRAVEHELSELRREVSAMSGGSAIKEVRLLKGLIKTLQDELQTLKSRQQRNTDKKTNELKQALDELEEVKASERNLRIRVKSLTTELAFYRRNKVQRTSSERNGHTTSRSGSAKNSFSESRENSFARNNSNVSRHSQRSTGSYKSQQPPLSARGRSASRDSNRLRERSLSAEQRRGSGSRPRSLSGERGRSASGERGRGRWGDSADNGPLPRSNFHVSPAGCRYPRFDPTSYVREKERRKQQVDTRRRNGSGRLSANGSGDRSDRRFKSSSPAPSDRSSRGSVHSRTPSIESMSDIAPVSDASEDIGSRIHRRHQRSADVDSFDHRLSSKPSHNNKKTPVSSTPEMIARTKSTFSRDSEDTNNTVTDERFDRSAEIADIDARLNRLQEFLKNNLTT